MKQVLYGKCPKNCASQLFQVECSSNLTKYQAINQERLNNDSDQASRIPSFLVWAGYTKYNGSGKDILFSLQIVEHRKPLPEQIRGKHAFFEPQGTVSHQS